MSKWLVIPDYPDLNKFDEVITTLANSPGIVEPKEISQLKTKLSDIYFNKGFVIQAGDCAESFDIDESEIDCNIELLLSQTGILTDMFGGRVLPIGRIAGQYAKPRTKTHEISNNNTIQSYYGDLINSYSQNVLSRKPDPTRMVTGYNLSKKIYKKTKGQIFTSHEALLLPYEYSLTRKIENKKYNLGAHFLWIGVRTNAINGLHVKYASKIENPVGVKIGLKTTADELIDLINLLNPNNIAGKLTLIHRMGADKVHHLKPLVAKVQEAKKKVLWFCDPMHGNTYMYPGKDKVRYFEDIISEIDEAIAIHKEYGSNLHGIHLEQTSAAVNECVSRKEKYSYNYKSLMDPRLNNEQALSIVKHIFNEL